jgi:UDP-galactopyranose mutase
MVRNVHLPHVEYAPGRDGRQLPRLRSSVIRIHETKHASGQQCEGTVLGFEFTTHRRATTPSRSEPQQVLQRPLQDYLARRARSRRTFFAGRLANYLYIDMDDCMRQSLDASEEILAAVGAPA